MNRRIKLSASLICADLLNLESDLSIIHQKGFDYIHFDVMDGHFVPGIGLGIFFWNGSLPVSRSLWMFT